jgi:hypothetical protein
MDLKEFTKETITQIVSAVREANEQINDFGASIPTDYFQGSKAITSFKDGEKNIIDIEFDVAVSAVESANVGGGAGIKVAAFNIGLGTNSQNENSTLSRVKFTLPLVLPEKSK